jgi:hypothetical protein
MTPISFDYSLLIFKAAAVANGASVNASMQYAARR